MHKMVTMQCDSTDCKSRTEFLDVLQCLNITFPPTAVSYILDHVCSTGTISGHLRITMDISLAVSTSEQKCKISFRKLKSISPSALSDSIPPCPPNWKTWIGEIKLPLKSTPFTAPYPFVPFLFFLLGIDTHHHWYKALLGKNISHQQIINIILSPSGTLWNQTFERRQQAFQLQRLKKNTPFQACF